MTIAAANFFAAMTGGASAAVAPPNAVTGFATAIGSALAVSPPFATPISPPGAETSAPVDAPPVGIADSFAHSRETAADLRAPSLPAIQADPTSPPLPTREAAQAEPSRVRSLPLQPVALAKVEEPGRDKIMVGADAGREDRPPLPADPPSPVPAQAATPLPAVATVAVKSTSRARDDFAAPEKESDGAEELMVEVAGTAPTPGPIAAPTAGTAAASADASSGEPRGETAPPPPSSAPARPDGKMRSADPPTAGSTLADSSAVNSPPANAPAAGSDAAAPDMQTPATTFADRLALPGDARPTVQAVPGPDAGPAAPQAVPVAPPQSRPVAASTPIQPNAPSPDRPVIDARPGQIGREMGVQIARRLGAGGDELTVRLNPVEMGRIEVRLSFDERGVVRVGMAAESAAALDMLRRDSADLGRALTEAGVRADANSFRFDSRSGQGAQDQAGQFWQRQSSGGGSGRGGSQHGSTPGSIHGAADDGVAGEDFSYRPLRTRGRVDLMA